jgi:hypothetical protein
MLVQGRSNFTASPCSTTLNIQLKKVEKQINDDLHSNYLLIDILLP